MCGSEHVMDDVVDEIRLTWHRFYLYQSSADRSDGKQLSV